MANPTPQTLQPRMNRSAIDCRGSKVGVVGALLGVRKFLPSPTFQPRTLHSLYRPHKGWPICGPWPTKYEGWDFNSGNYLFTTDTK